MIGCTCFDLSYGFELISSLVRLFGSLGLLFSYLTLFLPPYPCNCLPFFTGLGMLVQELIHLPGGAAFGENNPLKAVQTVPIEGWVQIITFISLYELATFKRTYEKGADLGFDPMGMNSPEMQLKEVKNGRLVSSWFTYPLFVSLGLFWLSDYRLSPYSSFVYSFSTGNDRIHCKFKLLFAFCLPIWVCFS